MCFYSFAMSFVKTTNELPLEIRKAAEEAVAELLPKKLKVRYNSVYDAFEGWCKAKNVRGITEDVLLAYFVGKTKQNYKASTLCSTYSMLKSTLSIKRNIDISKFHKLIAYLKRQGEGYQTKKSKVLSRIEIDRFLGEAPDEEFLMLKVVLVIGVAGACRCDELTKMSIDDVKDKNTVLMIRIPESKTYKPRCFIVAADNGNELNLALFRKYRALRPAQTPHRRLFLNYKNGKCTTQAVGIHTFGKIPRKVVAYLGLGSPEKYTGHCLRRSSATLLVDGGGDITSLKRLGGWKSPTVAEGYIEESLANQLVTANRIMGMKVENNANITKDGEVAECSKSDSFHLVVGDANNFEKNEVSVCSNSVFIRNKSSLWFGLNISNVESSTININIH